MAIAVIVGSGTVGQSWALMFARAGFSVRLFDIKTNQIDAALVGLRGQASILAQNQLLGGASVDEISSRVSGFTNLTKACDGASYVQECVPESLALKKLVWANIDKALAKQNTATVLASSSSNMVPSSFASGLIHEAQIIVAHPINPPFAIPVVEVVPSPSTDPKIVAAARDVLSFIGMKPVLLKKEKDGFLVNRLQYALLGEAYRLVADGVASPQDIDTAISDGLGARWSFMGPFQTIQLNAPNGIVDYCDRYSKSIERVLASQDNSVTWQKEVCANIDAELSKETPHHLLSDRTTWRNRRLVALAVHKQTQALNDRKSFAIPCGDKASAPLFVPPLATLASMIETSLTGNFKNVSARVVRCPDLRQWGLAKPGLSGSGRLVDVGGVPNLMDPRFHDVAFDLNDIAKRADLPGAYILGATAAHNRTAGANAELMVCMDTATGMNFNRYAKVAEDGSAFCAPYPSQEFGLLGNLYASRGETGDVIEVKASVRVGDKNFVSCIKEGLLSQVKGAKHIGLGGVFKVKRGRVKAHVMPDFKKSVMEDGTQEVVDWLKFYEYDEGLTCLTYLLTGDPTITKDDTGMNLRLEHAHFFNDQKAQGGHYHEDVTPDIVEYVAYFAPADRVYRLSNAYKRPSRL